MEAKSFCPHKSQYCFFLKGPILEVEIILSKFLFWNTQAKRKDVKYSFPGKAGSSFFSKHFKNCPDWCTSNTKKSFFETDELFDYRVAFRNDIMARQDFQKVCRSLCTFQPYLQQESFCGKKSFFLFHLCVDLRRELGFNSTSQKHSTIVCMCTESFQAQNKSPVFLGMMHQTTSRKVALAHVRCLHSPMHLFLHKPHQRLKQFSSWGLFLHLHIKLEFCKKKGISSFCLGNP